MKGVDPNLMGIGQAEATISLLEDMNLKASDVDYVEIHEAFAATAVAALEEIKNRLNYDWETAFKNKKINPYGGSIAIGHPFGATGVRLASNAIMDLKEDANANRILATACAHGGVAGSMMFEKAIITEKRIFNIYIKKRLVFILYCLAPSCCCNLCK